MKRLIASIALIFLVFSCASAFANSGPVFWQGYPSSEIMSIENDSPIEVKKENLVFDFSDDDGSGFAVDGKVTATYEMVNATDEPQSVQMAFPFVGTLNNILPNDITITADDSAVPYDMYIGDAVDSHGTSSGDNKVSFDFNHIVNTIKVEPYKAKNFSQNEKGKLYIINVKPTTDQEINFAVDFNFDSKKTKVFTHGFNQYECDDKKTRIAAWCYRPESLEIYVLGEDIDFNINAYTDGDISKETDLFQHQISTQEVELEPYLMEYIKKNTNIKNMEMFSETQLYNVYAKALDTYFTSGFSSENDLLDHETHQRILTLVYNVEFAPNSQRKVSVSYNTSGTMDRTQTIEPLYSFDYILNPARNWSDFKNLNIEIIPPQRAPHIVESNIEFTRGQDNTYTASLAQLPEDDLSFTLYAHEKITLLDKVQGSLNRGLGYPMYLAPPLIGALIFIVLGIIIVMVVFKRKKNDYV
jgi:hypothetical protein